MSSPFLKLVSTRQPQAPDGHTAESVEKVLASRKESNGTTAYLVKWKNLIRHTTNGLMKPILMTMVPSEPSVVQVETS